MPNASSWVTTTMLQQAYKIFREHHNIQEKSKHNSKRVKVPNLAKEAKSELLVAVKGRRERQTIP